MMNMVSIMRSAIIRSPKLWTINFRRFLNEGSRIEATSSVLDSVPKLEEDADVKPEIGTTGLDYEGQLGQWDEIARRSLLFSFNLDKETHSKLYYHLQTFGELAHYIPINKKDSQYALVVFQQDEAVHSFQETALHPAKMPISRQQIFLPEKYLSGLPVGEVHEELRPQKKKPMEKVYNDLHFAKDGITGQIDLLYNSLKAQDTDILKRCFVRGQIQHLLEKFFPHLAVQPFGSSMCGLSSAYSSDLDLYLVDLQNGNGDGLSSTVLPKNRALIDVPSSFELAIIGKLLPVWSSHLEAAQFLLRARIPLLKLRHKVLNLDVDLCGQKAQRNGKHISKLLHTFAGLDARVKPLVLAIKEVAQQLQIVRYPQPNPTMTNFMVTALVVSFLQTRTPSILPSAEYADSLHNERNQSSLFVSQNSNTTGDLLLEFFQHYHKFDFLHQGLSIDLGQTVELTPPNIKLGISCTLYGNNLCRNKNKMDYLKFFRMSCEHALRVLEKPFDNSMEPWGLEALLKTKNPLRIQQKKRLPQGKKKLARRTDAITDGEKVPSITVIPLSDLPLGNLTEDPGKEEPAVTAQKLGASTDVKQKQNEQKKSDVLQVKTTFQFGTLDKDTPVKKKAASAAE